MKKMLMLYKIHKKCTLFVPISFIQLKCIDIISYDRLSS